MPSPLNDPKLEALLDRLHAESDTQIDETSAYFAQRRRDGILDFGKPYDVACDNTTASADEYHGHFEFVNDPRNRFRTMTVPFEGGFELTVRV